LSGKVHLDEVELSNMSVTLEIESESIDTGEPKRDAHLKSPDFFDVKKFPKLVFRSTSVTRAPDGYKVVGDLTLRGVKKSIELLVTGLSSEVPDPWGHTRRGAKASATLNRADFGLRWNAPLESGGLAVGEEVSLDLDVEMMR
jgi:polyisoprenoid-binding protein YceI